MTINSYTQASFQPIDTSMKQGAIETDVSSRSGTFMPIRTEDEGLLTPRTPRTPLLVRVTPVSRPLTPLAPRSGRCSTSLSSGSGRSSDPLTPRESMTRENLSPVINGLGHSSTSPDNQFIPDRLIDRIWDAFEEYSNLPKCFDFKDVSVRVSEDILGTTKIVINVSENIFHVFLQNATVAELGSGANKSVSDCVYFRVGSPQTIRQRIDWDYDLEEVTSLQSLEIQPHVAFDFRHKEENVDHIENLLQIHMDLLDKCSGAVLPELPQIVYLEDGTIKVIQKKYSSDLEATMKEDSFVNAADNELKTVSIEEYIGALLDVVSTLNIMHSQDFVHADIKPKNIFVDVIDSKVSGIVFDFDTTGPIEKIVEDGTDTYSDVLYLKYNLRTPLTDAYAFSRVVTDTFLKGSFPGDRMISAGEKVEYGSDEYNKKLHQARCHFIISELKAEGNEKIARRVLGLISGRVLSADEFKDKILKRPFGVSKSIIAKLEKLEEVIEMAEEMKQIDEENTKTYGEVGSLGSEEKECSAIEEGTKLGIGFLTRYQNLLQKFLKPEENAFK